MHIACGSIMITRIYAAIKRFFVIRYEIPQHTWYVDFFRPAGFYKLLAKLRMVWLQRELELIRYRKAFEGIGTVDRIKGGLVIDITEA